MADKNVPLDVAHQAVRLSELEGVLALQTHSLRTAVENMTSTLASVQAETRAIVNSVHDLAISQASNQRDKEAIDRLETNFADLNRRLEEWFSDSEARSEAKWREHEKARDEWRNENEVKNSTAKAELWRELNRIDRSLVFSRGYILALGALLGVLVGGFLWSLNERFTQQTIAINRTVETAQYNRALIDASRERQHQIELHLARNSKYQPQENPQ